MKQSIRVDYPSIEGHMTSETFLRSYDITEQQDAQDILNVVWRDFNRIDGEEFISSTESRSSMIGDVYSLLKSERYPNSRYFIVSTVGFVEVTEIGRERWLSADSKERGWGDVNKQLLNGEIIEGQL